MFKKHVLQRPKVQAKQQSYCCFVFAFSLVFTLSFFLTLSHKEHKELKHNLYYVFLKRKCKHWMENTHLSQRYSQCFNVFFFIAFILINTFCTTMRQSKREGNFKFRMKIVYCETLQLLLMKWNDLYVIEWCVVAQLGK